MSNEPVKEDEYAELREIVSEFQRILSDMVSDPESDIFMSDSTHGLTDAQMNRNFNV